MKSVLVALVLLAGMLASPTAYAVEINGVTVLDLGTPACAGRNLVLRSAQGTIHNNLTVSIPNGPQSPWQQFPSFLGSPYTALEGTMSYPAVGVVRFATPRTTLSFVWGTIDEAQHANVVQFYMGKTAIAFVNGDDILSAFGPASPSLRALNLSFRTKTPFDTLRFVSAAPPNYRSSFEIANLGVTCR